MHQYPLSPNSVAKHDVDAGLQGSWTIEIQLDLGESLIGPVSVIAVTGAGTDTPLVGDSLVISAVAIGQISAAPNIWGISFSTQGGTPKTYWLRATAQRNTTPPYGVHRTVRLIAGYN